MSDQPSEPTVLDALRASSPEVADALSAAAQALTVRDQESNLAASKVLALAKTERIDASAVDAIVQGHPELMVATQGSLALSRVLDVAIHPIFALVRGEIDSSPTATHQEIFSRCLTKVANGALGSWLAEIARAMLSEKKDW